MELPDPVLSTGFPASVECPDLVSFASAISRTKFYLCCSPIQLTEPVHAFNSWFGFFRAKAGLWVDTYSRSDSRASSESFDD
jgi:hypothetical protein